MDAVVEGSDHSLLVRKKYPGGEIYEDVDQRILKAIGEFFERELTQWQPATRLRRRSVAVQTEISVLLKKPFIVREKFHRIARFESIGFNRGIDLCF